MSINHANDWQSQENPNDKQEAYHAFDKPLVAWSVICDDDTLQRRALSGRVDDLEPRVHTNDGKSQRASSSQGMKASRGDVTIAL